ncbi:unnamed protein product [Effrenium voratum]|nr:unnamed protein product [Effrenium voratum]
MSSMLDCHIQLVAREGWQAAGCVFRCEATLAGCQADVGLACSGETCSLFLSLEQDQKPTGSLSLPSRSCLCLSYEPEQQLCPRAEAKFRQRLALFKRSRYVFYVLLELSCQVGRDFC